LKSTLICVSAFLIGINRPWCLAELYAAFEGNIPIVPVNLIGGGHNFVDGAQLLSTLTPKTLDQTGTGASAVLQDLGIDVTELGKKLFAVIPKVIAVSFNTNEGGTIGRSD
jgi:hypothetical protein